jgi:hypothetical protein
MVAQVLYLNMYYTLISRQLIPFLQGLQQSFMLIFHVPQYVILLQVCIVAYQVNDKEFKKLVQH